MLRRAGHRDTLAVAGAVGGLVDRVEDFALDYRRGASPKNTVQANRRF
jgi:hypothetical protein